MPIDVEYEHQCPLPEGWLFEIIDFGEHRLLAMSFEHVEGRYGTVIYEDKYRWFAEYFSRAGLPIGSKRFRRCEAALAYTERKLEELAVQDSDEGE